MNNCVFTFISNQDIVQYPIDLIFRNFKCDKFLFVNKGDKINTDAKIIEAELRIEKPDDISVAQNYCLDWLRKNTNYDFYIHPQADIYLPEEDAKTLNKRLQVLSKSGAYKIEIDRVRLYYECEPMSFGFQVIGKNCPYNYIGDGAYLDKYFGTTTDLLKGISAIDVGYFGLENYRRHAKNHSEVWRNTICDFAMHDKELKEFISLVKNKAIKREGYKGVIIDPQDYVEIFDYFNLHGEFEEIKNLL